MKIQSLTVTRAASYEADSGQLKGSVEMESSTGAMVVNLSNRAMAQIFGIIKKEVCATATSNAKQAVIALDDAENEQPLLEAMDMEATDENT